MTTFIFYMYYLPMILTIISLFVCRVIYCDHEWKDRYSDNIVEKPVKLYGWIYILLIMFSFIPLINIGEIICIWCIFGTEYHVKQSVKKWFNNLWIIKILSKEY